MKTIHLFIALCFFQSMPLVAQEKPTILYVGDSHSFGQMGKVIHENLSTISDNVIMESSCGSSPSTWLGTNKYAKTVCGFWKKDQQSEIRTIEEHITPNFLGELAIYRPQVTIIQLGTNMAVGSPKSFTKDITKMMEAVNKENSLCIWIGPPDANSKRVTRKNLDDTNKLLIKLSEENNCHYIDSLKLTSFPEKIKEGIHYPKELSSSWGEELSREILLIIQNSI